jgi:membrane-associated phospholipid phosphatase
VLYQAELYPEFRLDPLPEQGQKGNMVDLSRRWPLGLGEQRWWTTAGAALVVLALSVTFDRDLSLWAQGWPASVRGALEQITPYGESEWILYPSAALFLLTALVALVVRWKLMRTLLWQFAALYGFIFAGIGFPWLVTTLIKGLVGRGRPEHFDHYGALHFSPNWVDWSFHSFPSGHSSTAFALAAVIAFVSPRWYYPALVFAAAIAASRLSMGVHYASDVVVGGIIGLLGAYLVRLAFAQRRWVFEIATDGSVLTRPMSSLKRYLRLKRRGSGPARQPDRP